MKKYLTLGVVELGQWADAHPAKAAFTIVVFIALFALGMILEDVQHLFAVLAAMAVAYAVWARVFTRDTRRGKA